MTPEARGRGVFLAAVLATAALLPGCALLDWMGVPRDGPASSSQGAVSAQRQALQARAGRALLDAGAALQEGRLEEAADLVLPVLQEADLPSPAREDSVALARELGLRFFSRGELTRAREIWRLALELDPANERILRDLDEVEMRLERLERIKEGGDGP